MAGTVTVACKLPNGLVLRVFDMVKRQEPVLGGGMREFEQAQQKGMVVTLKGCAAPFGAPISLVGGYSLTPNVDADFFNEWLKQNADHDAVKNRLIFAHEKPDVVNDRARSNESVRSGLEPLSQDKDPRAPRGVTKEDKAA